MIYIYWSSYASDLGVMVLDPAVPHSSIAISLVDSVESFTERMIWLWNKLRNACDFNPEVVDFPFWEISWC